MADDALVIFTPSGKRGRVPVGTTVLQAARQIGADLDSVCGGRGICSKCQVTPQTGSFPKHGITVAADALSPRNAVEDRYDRIRGLKPGRRLGCQAQVLADMVVDVPPESQLHRQVIRKSATEREMVMDPAVRLHLVTVAEPSMDDPTGDFQRLATALDEQWGVKGLQADLEVLSTIQTILRDGKWQVTAAVWNDGREAPRLLALWPGFREEPPLGIAVDLGSTTIAGHLVDLTDGSVLASSGLMNPQIRFGEDLMSRVSYAMLNEGGAVEMTSAVRDGLGQLSAALAAEAGVSTDDIFEVVIVCNPVMHHLMLGIDPVELGQAPFAPASAEAFSIRADEVGMGIHPAGRLYILPLIAGHVGADAAAVVLSEQPQKSDDLLLCVDVGTNAEIVLGNRERVLACSSPTGPAFEGAQISSGQRAAPGAIERVRIDAVTKEPRIRVIGIEKWSDEAGFDEELQALGGVTGICGSGIIEAIAEMRIAGLVDRSGLIGSADQTGTARCQPNGRTHAYLLYDAGGEHGPVIRVTQGDVRAIQLAKSALSAGARLLMDEMGVEHVDRIALAGAFGAHISPFHAMILGMIPDCVLDKVVAVGNAAGTGARIALCSRAARDEIEAEVHRITRVESAIAPRFQEHFVNSNALPNRVEPYPELARIVQLPEPSFNTSHGTEGGRRRRRHAG